MDDLRQDVRVIRESQIRMEADIKHHVKRTNLLESMVMPLHRAKIFVQYLVAVSGAILTLYGLYKLMKVI
jgi:hypothetical protein